MTEIGKLFDAISYGEADMAQVLADIMRDGVFRLPGQEFFNELLVGGTATLSVNVLPGHAMIQGFWYYNDTTKNVAIAANSSGSTRFDRIVLHLDRTANTLQIIAVTGTISAPLPLVQNSTVWELSLAQVSVPNGATSISSGNITDERPNVTLCGFTGAHQKNSMPAILLNYHAVTDVFNGESPNTARVITIGNFQNTSPRSTILILYRGFYYLHCSSGTDKTYSFFTVGGSTQYFTKNAYEVPGHYWNMVGEGYIAFNIFAGTHALTFTVQTPASAGGTQEIILTAASFPDFFHFNVVVIEIPEG